MQESGIVSKKYFGHLSSFREKRCNFALLWNHSSLKSEISAAQLSEYCLIGSDIIYLMLNLT